MVSKGTNTPWSLLNSRIPVRRFSTSFRILGTLNSRDFDFETESNTYRCSGWKMKDGGKRDEMRFENASIMTEPDIKERIKIERRPQDNRNQQEI